MHVDARELPNNSTIEGDICIVGAGAAGISMAMDWMNTNKKVILLEGGGFEIDNKMQDLFKAKQTGQRYYPLQSSRLHMFGGTTGHWAGYCSTYDPIDFVKRDWVPLSGWPIKREDLDPYYPHACKIVEIGPYIFDDAYWRSKDETMKPFPFDNKVVWNKIWQFSPPTRFGQKYKDTIINSKNIHLYTYANVVDIKADDNINNITEVIVKNFAGKQHTVKAKYFVLACCSIQNARLLLAANSQTSKGLGNDNDLVGRHFMDHLEVNSAFLSLPKAMPLKMYMIDFFKTKVRAELAVTPEAQEQHKMLNGTVSFEAYELAKDQPAMIDMFPDSASKTIEMMNGFADTSNTKTIADKPFKEYQLFTRIEQSPNPESRITLSNEKDELGVPRIVFNWKLTPLEKHSIRELYTIVGQQVGKAGLGRVRMMDWLDDENDNAWPEFLGGGWHHMGTTRMHDDPKQGVTDANCKVHGINNLFMAGASNYTTSGAANPTLTLIALTLRLSDHLKTLSS